MITIEFTLIITLCILAAMIFILMMPTLFIDFLDNIKELKRRLIPQIKKENNGGL